MPKINFSHPNQTLKDQGFIDCQLHVDLADPELLTKLKNCLIPLVGRGDEEIVIVPPGLQRLSVLVIVAIHGLVGYFPKIVNMVKTDTGFEPLPELDLQQYRNSCVRVSREGLRVL